MEDYIETLIELHRGLERQGPGDAELSRQIMQDLPTLPSNPRIVDLGCGAGAGALLLAEHFGVTVTAVDAAQPFLDDMMAMARARGLADRIKPLACDFAALPFEQGSIDLLWSEGAAYNLTFAGALKSWRPLLSPNAVAVISEITWFTSNPPKPLRDFWEEAYPPIADEAENIARAQAAGFEVLRTQRLLAQAWWDHYYNPLKQRIASISAPDAMMQNVVAETLDEIDLFHKFSEHYGYTFYVMTAGSSSL